MAVAVAVAVVAVADPLSTLLSILVVFTWVIARAPCPMRKVLIPSCSAKEMEAEIHKANCPLSPGFQDRKAIQDLDPDSVTPGALPRLSAPAPDLSWGRQSHRQTPVFQRHLKLNTGIGHFPP